MEVVLWCLVVTAVSTVLAQTLRYVMKQVLSEKIFVIVDECLAAMQCSIAILECGVISDVFGGWSLISLLTVFVFGTIKHTAFIRGGYIGNPVCFIDRYYKAGKKSVDSPAFIIGNIGAQLVGSLLAHPLSKLFWGRTYSEHHNRIMLVECQTTLEVTFFQGFTVEFITTLIAWMTDWFTPMKWKPPVRSVVSLSLLLTFVNTSGAWMNPAMATAHTINCKGHDNHWEHFITYWLGPYMAAIFLYEMKELYEVIKVQKETSADENATMQDNAFSIASPNQEERRSTSLPSSNGIYTEVSANAFQNLNGNKPGTKYHRSPGGSLRSRISNIGPG